MRFNKEESVAKLGVEVVNQALSSNAEPTSRMMYPAFEPTSHIGKDEYAGEPVEVDGYIVTAYYYVAKDEEVCGVEPEFEIEEVW